MYRRDKLSSTHNIDPRLASKYNQLEDLERDMKRICPTVGTDRKRSRPIDSSASKTRKKLGKHTKQQEIQHLLFQPAFPPSCVSRNLALWIHTLG